MRPVLIAVAWHPGAARAVAPVVVAAERLGWSSVMGTSEASMPIARRAGVAGLRVLAGGPEAAALLNDWQRPAVVIAGVSEGDMPEKYLIAAARAAGIRSCAVLDNWGWYEERLMGTMGPQALPDVIAVINDEARRAIAEAGFFQGEVVTTGHPGLDEFETMSPIADRRRRSGRRALGLPPDGEVVAFASQPLAQQFGGHLGYNQYDAIAMLIAALPATSCLVVAAHPREHWALLAACCSSRVTLVRNYDPADLYAAADLVTSCFSAALTEALLAGRPAISIQPHPNLRGDLWTNECGATITAATPEQLVVALRAAREMPTVELKRRRALLAIPSDATARVLKLAQDLIAQPFHRDCSS